MHGASMKRSEDQKFCPECDSLLEGHDVNGPICYAVQEIARRDERIEELEKKLNSAWNVHNEFLVGPHAKLKRDLADLEFYERRFNSITEENERLKKILDKQGNKYGVMKGLYQSLEYRLTESQKRVEEQDAQIKAMAMEVIDANMPLVKAKQRVEMLGRALQNTLDTLEGYAGRGYTLAEDLLPLIRVALGKARGDSEP